MSVGVVMWFNKVKGYGFIKPDAGGKDVFVHATAIEKSGMKELKDGQRVSFEIDSRNGKSQATNLKGA